MTRSADGSHFEIMFFDIKRVFTPASVLAVLFPFIMVLTLHCLLFILTPHFQQTACCRLLEELPASGMTSLTFPPSLQTRCTPSTLLCSKIRGQLVPSPVWSQACALDILPTPHQGPISEHFHHVSPACSTSLFPQALCPQPRTILTSLVPSIFLH